MNILVVDDNASLLKGLLTFLKQERHTAHGAGTQAAALEALRAQAFDLVITDLKLPDGSGMEVIQAARLREPPPEVILMTAYGTVETAVSAMKLGALDYLIKPVPLEEFAFRLDRVARLRSLSAETDLLQRAQTSLLETAGLATPLDDITGESAEIIQVKELIKKTAPFPSTVLLSGETGTGKEMAARAVHALSPWSKGPFVRVNCASIPETLFESELFGHEKGAFTDARERRIGRFEAARHGTLFLDEVGEVPLNLQAKLLRALQDKEIIRVGGSQPLQIETRIVAATNRNLDAMVAAGTFRSDLLYRLAVIRIALPPLRARAADIPRIAQKLLEQVSREFGRPTLSFAPGVTDYLAQRSWKGNIRELKNAIERAVVLAEGPHIEIEGFPPDEAEPRPQIAPGIAPEAQDGLTAAVAAFERTLIQAALQRSQGVKSKAADELKIPRTNLLYRMKKLGLLSDTEN